MDGGLEPVDCTIYDVLDVLLHQPDGRDLAPAGHAFPLAARAADAAARAVQSGRPLAAQRGASLRPERAPLQPVPRSRPAIFLRLFPARRRDAGGGAGRQEAPHRRQAAARPAGPDGAGHRLRLGRPGADAGARLRRAGHRHHAVDRAARRGAAPVRRPRAWPTASRSSCWTTARCTGASTASSRSACSSMSASATTSQFFDVVKRCLAPDGVALLHAIGRSDGPGCTNPWIAKYIFPGGYSPALSEVLAGGRAEPAWSPPTSRSCGCTMPRRCATGAAASPPTATPSRPCTTSGSAGCSSSISPAPSSRSAARATWSSRSSSRATRPRCR